MREVTRAMEKQEPLTVKTRNGERSIGRGSIINLGSAHSYIALPGKMPYTTSKFAVLGMSMQSLSLSKTSVGLIYKLNIIF